MTDIAAELRAIAAGSGPRSVRAKQAAELIRMERGYRWVGIYEITRTEIAAIAWTGSQAPAWPRYQVTQGLGGRAIASRRPMFVQDVARDPGHRGAFPSTKSEAVIPVIVGDDVVRGLIDVESDRVGAFAAADEAFLAACANALQGIYAEPTIDVIVKQFEHPDEIRVFEKGRLELVTLADRTFGRATYEPGWRWSEHVGPEVGATRCEVEHFGLVLSGCATAAFDDGRVIELRAGQLFYIPSTPHDSWVVGDEPYVSLHLHGAEHYATK